MKRKMAVLSICLVILSVLLVGCSKSEELITTLDDASKSKIGVMTGTTGEQLAKSRFPEANIRSFDDIMDAVVALKTGQINAIVTAYPTAMNVSKNNPEIGYLDEALQNEDTAIAVRKGNEKLLVAVDQVITDLKKDGTLADMKVRWFKQDLSPYEEMYIAVPKDGNVLKIGVNATREPFCFIDKNGAVIGHDGELAKIIGAKLGRPIEFVDMKFSALISALQANKVDLIVTGMTSTEERKQSVNFTQPYFANAQVLMVKKAPIAQTNRAEGLNISFIQSVTNSFNNNIIMENRYLLIVEGLKTTVIISILASIFGTLLGALICFMRMSRKKALQMLAKVYISILRGTPVLVLLMLVFYVVFASVNINPTFVAVIAFGLNFGAYAAEIFRTGIEGVDKGQNEAGIAMGFTKIQTFLYIIMPQAVRQVLPVYKGEFISLVKMTSIVGYIAVQDLTKASDIIRSRTFDAFFPLIMVAVLYFLISWSLTLALDYIEFKTDPKARRKQVENPEVYLRER
ncbi:MAG: ABC transporter substrate-binding protein/permease [Syntrophomonas sp.]|nr:ABC transporter substrate-binding protein/permease [Syntrophomonas sp.]